MKLLTQRDKSAVSGNSFDAATKVLKRLVITAYPPLAVLWRFTFLRLFLLRHEIKPLPAIRYWFCWPRRGGAPAPVTKVPFRTASVWTWVFSLWLA